MKLNFYKTYLSEEKTPILVKEPSKYTVDKRYKYNDPGKIYKLALSLNCDKLAEEYVYCLCLDTACHVIGLFEISHGTVNSSFINTREIFQKALLIGATNIILWHNHPSGDCTPSNQDFQATEKIIDAGEIIGIKCLDHIIVTTDGYYSMMENKQK